ncbi:MAG: hypothetical protein CME65_06945 [Halobacteriovoraceae bacterium]|nr:hypothetical protein [Halobacteriovoraceae bacterium]|tara:strand:- start:3053 stop:3646 length:594 start_codon:yes stop_codon:yes gene_type:complete
MDIDKISLFALIFFNIILSVKFLMSHKEWTGKTLSILCGHLGVSGLIISESLLFLNKINLVLFETLSCFFLGWLFGIFTMQVSMLSISEMNKKKMTTLWKTPVVAALAGMLLKSDYIGFLFLGFIGICLFLIYQNRPRLRYLLPKTLLVLSVAPLFFSLSLSQLWIMNIAVTIFIVLTNVFHNLVFASNLLAAHEKK